ncbi:MAG: YbaB/EbfC family nucleoid-associated protein [Alphaproteobacteria bacterium]|nr:YbaB/EbfC family nucleoid-associated protein [Alphaproteobacteria bacterium]MCZ6763879.1 YbaB/EbfC family nucleoid-associated protein [Alphaproteobacteria bacterium]
MKNLGAMMKQAQAMQGKIAEMQEKMEEAEIEGAAGAGMVRVTLNGKGEMKRIAIDRTLIDPAEPAMLEDLIVAAHNDAKGKVEARMAEEMQALTGGLGLPPDFKLPF